MVTKAIRLLIDQKQLDFGVHFTYMNNLRASDESESVKLISGLSWQ